ncbi:CD5 antigen-like [Cebidichthys violaceus]|uniref:CD5 antigen-like n=1 Tax=Cebidichthys violaceus TaxID=271503 RepID=UPI0035C9A56E
MLQVKHQRSWEPVCGPFWTLKEAEVAWRELDCGSAVSIRERRTSSLRSVWLISLRCLQSGYTLRDCLIPFYSIVIVGLTCSGSLVSTITGTNDLLDTTLSSSAQPGARRYLHKTPSGW